MYCHKMTSKGLFEVQEVLSTAGDANVVPHVDPEPNGAGEHDGVTVLYGPMRVRVTMEDQMYF